jgi:hypothetical protein
MDQNWRPLLQKGWRGLKGIINSRRTSQDVEETYQKRVDLRIQKRRPHSPGKADVKGGGNSATKHFAARICLKVVG